MSYKRIKDFPMHVASEWEEYCENDIPETGNCSHCGAESPTDSNVCIVCGEIIDWEKVFAKENDNDN